MARGMRCGVPWGPARLRARAPVRRPRGPDPDEPSTPAVGVAFDQRTPLARVWCLRARYAALRARRRSVPRVNSHSNGAVAVTRRENAVNKHRDRRDPRRVGPAGPRTTALCTAYRTLYSILELPPSSITGTLPPRFAPWRDPRAVAHACAGKEAFGRSSLSLPKGSSNETRPPWPPPRARLAWKPLS